MPTFSRWAIRLALFYLLSSWFLELWRLSQPHYVPMLPWAQRVTVFHLFFVGWLTQLIFGVAYWMFPTESRKRPRGSESLGIAVLVALNVGVVLRVVSEPLLTPSSQQSVWPILLVVGGALQWLAALGFSINIWRRIRGRGRSK